MSKIEQNICRLKVDDIPLQALNYVDYTCRYYCTKSLKKNSANETLGAKFTSVINSFQWYNGDFTKGTRLTLNCKTVFVRRCSNR